MYIVHEYVHEHLHENVLELVYDYLREQNDELMMTLVLTAQLCHRHVNQNCFVWSSGEKCTRISL